MTVINFLKNSAERYPQKTALIYENISLSYLELLEQVNNFSKNLIANTQSDVVSMMSENSSSFVIAYLGIINSGKIPHIHPTNISENNLNSQLLSSGSSMHICSNSVFESISKYDGISVPTKKIDSFFTVCCDSTISSKINETAYLIYTSGTTSIPKGVGILHSMVEFTTKNIVDVLNYSDSDIDVLPLPLYHSFGLGCLHTSLFTGATLILLKNAIDLQKILDTIQKNKATTLAAIPATLTKLLQFENLETTFSNLRLIMTNSTKIPLSTIQFFKKILKNGNLATYYGLTEASRSTFMIFDSNSDYDESVGQPGPGVEIKIKNSDIDTEIGEIWVKGKNVLQSYWQNPEADKQISDGWLKTGDLGFLKNNHLYLVGRTDDVINIGGEKVFPDEIEQVVKEIDGVENAVAFGIDHEIFGQVIKLNIVKSKNSKLDKSLVLKH